MIARFRYQAFALPVASPRPRLARANFNVPQGVGTARSSPLLTPAQSPAIGKVERKN
jgi:hypothetical protein